VNSEWLISLGSAFWFGLLTSISPCPLATNIAAISFISRRVDRPHAVLGTGILYALGRTLVYVGLAALLVSSLLSAPGVSRDDWKSLRQHHKVVEVPEPDAEAQEIEVWSYRPELLADGDRVDPLSLYLSLKGNRDERVEAALEEMMETLPW